MFELQHVFFFLNQKLLSHIFDNGIIIDNINMIALKAYSLNREKRKHYIMDEYDNYLNASNNCQLLNELLKVRINYNNMNSNQGPFHNEVYPYDFYILEKILLNDDEINYYKNNKQLSEEIISLIVDLNQI